jgi:hypothetical protein
VAVLRLEKELRKQTKVLVEIRMSYPIPNPKAKKKPVRFSTYSNQFDAPLPGSNIRFNLTETSSKDHSSLPMDSPMDHEPQSNSTTSPSPAKNSPSLNCCHKLVELIQSVLNNNQTEDSVVGAQAPNGRNTRSDDLQIYVRRKGDFQVSPHSSGNSDPLPPPTPLPLPTPSRSCS